ncbi:MAG: EthD domain-containing protein [Xanthobacteraceae bacterium]
MIHQFIFAGPKPGLTADAFTSYWINFHAVDYAAKIKQIRQYLVAARLPVATQHDVPAHLQGVAEIWIKDEADQLASLQSPEFLQGARPDEPRWAAFWLTLVLDTRSQVLTENQGPAPAPDFVKLYTLLKRKPELSLDRFRRQLVDDRRDLGKRYELARHLVGFSRDVLYGFGEPAFDAVEVIALPDVNALEALLGDESFAGALTQRAYVHDTYAFNFVAREHWIIRPGER